MCRHLAYVGAETTLASLVIAPEHSLYRQAWEPRLQRHGTVNADGFGVGWYADDDELPARYRRAVPMWADGSFAEVARVTRTRCLLAAVRSATPLLWALVLARLDEGQDPAEALAAVAVAASAAAAGRYNFLLTDGERIWATAWGDTLFWRTGGHSVAVASEPYDERPEWREAPGRSVLVADRNGVDVAPLRPARKEAAAP